MKISRIFSMTLLAGFAACGPAQAADAAHGQKIFAECAACHSAAKAPSGVGPSLYGVFGRKAGTLDDFRFSPAMKRANIVWSRETLESYIADPQKAIPANRMPFGGIPDAQNRADLLDYMEQTFK
ncbi:MAG: cytochrome [Betaproteobacteria bacterium]|nr:cytochrome [Betaproteobacteria bacterium]